MKVVPLRSLVLLLGLVCFGELKAHAQLPIEPVPSTRTLPEVYPQNWIFAQDLSFFSLVTGRVYIVDPTAKRRDVQGMVDAGQFATFSFSQARHELYVGETFYSRGMRGERSDFITIYDTQTLLPKAQVELPGGKRAQTVTQKNALQQSADGRFLFVYNFTPAASVTVLDLDTHDLVNEIQLPGCSMIYQNGKSGFATLCGDGSMMAFDLDETGQVTGEFRTEPFNDIDADPLFMKAVIVNQTAYFPTFEGRIQPVKLAGGAPVVGAKKYMTGAVRNTDHGQYARPAGWQVITRDAAGKVYILMRPDAKPGDHKSGGSYVWVYNPKSGAVVREYELASNSISIEVTLGSNPMLVATSEEMHLDIYDLKSGEHLRKIGGWGPATPFSLYAVQ
ncbi:MAG: amine dehydrogenase [Alphaproteobacteria bacterium]|nr:MAG: amine dehydrogenase [Alphaproteobacteria bacterium]